MQLICPQCRGELQMEGRRAVCHLHGGAYEVLFDREMEAAMRTAERRIAPVGPCVNHPRTDALYECPGCAKLLCALCAFEINGRHLCSDCMTNAPEAPSPSVAVDKTPAAPATVTFQREGVALMCVQHPEVAAVERCRVCWNGVCATCDFALPGGMHICPSCIDKEPQQEISAARKKRMLIGLGLAVYSSIALLLLLTGAFHSMFGATGEDDGVNMVIGYAILFPTIGGVAVSFSSVDRRLRNSGGIWTAVIWNCVLLGIFMLLTVIGLSMG